MLSSIAFQTRARTIDHLGREQIADCPTAISELWKNSYDAYATAVGLHIYDGDYVITTIVDNGHGMNSTEFKEKWLVVGTESKRSNTNTSVADRLGLPFRVKQGQKGIGRLSSANLGSLLLIVSKRTNSRFVASLIDWRLFENPFLYLMDIQIPIVEFDSKEEIFNLLPDMFSKLLENVYIEKEASERDERVNEAWTQYCSLEESEGKSLSTFDLINNTVINTLIDEQHFSEWPLWRGEFEHGTIMVISDVQSDLIAQLPRYDSDVDGHDSTIIQAREQLFKTLSNITDPFLTSEERDLGLGVVDFLTTATARDKKRLKNIIDGQPPFDINWLHELEHVIDGSFDFEGNFRGRVKAFGKWLDEDAFIPPGIPIPTRKDSVVGAFSLRIGTYEQKLDSTSHSEEAYRSFEAKSDMYAGFMIYRNGLRVMPYGREGSDFFQIEKRRTKHAGREFWSLRRLFGRVALSKDENPNLRDKAGREGLIDNKSAKVFRDLIINVLQVTARTYFGTGSKLRDSIIPDKVNEYRNKKLAEAKTKLRIKSRKEFDAKLKASENRLLSLTSELSSFSNLLTDTSLRDESTVIIYRNSLNELKNSFKDLGVGTVPRNLGLIEERYREFRNTFKQSKEMLALLDSKIAFALETLKPRSPKEIIYSEVSANASFLHRRIRGWASECKQILSSELSRLQALQEDRNKYYHAKTLPLLEQVEKGVLSIADASAMLEDERDIQDAENSLLFESYSSVLSNLQENIDLASLASHNESVADELREEVDRLHALAQLGITVEIIGHEIESLEHTVSASLKDFPLEVQSTQAYLAVRDGHEALIDRLRFLSPLKLSGPKTRIKITGQMIFEYIQNFFASKFLQQSIHFDASESFLKFSVHDQPSRIYPVFINLVNNAAYWVEYTKDTIKKINLDIVDSRVVLSDNGPGVAEDDVEKLFKIFFTKKVRGGRGVGLYLCKSNLAASGHSISYDSGEKHSLSGACFIIEFRGGKYDGN